MKNKEDGILHQTLLINALMSSDLEPPVCLAAQCLKMDQIILMLNQCNLSPFFG